MPAILATVAPAEERFSLQKTSHEDSLPLPPHSRNNLIGVFAPAAREDLAAPRQVFQRGLNDSIDSPRLGDPVKAHRFGAERSRELHSVRVPQLADIVVIDSHPAHIAHRGRIVKDLARGIMVSPGISPETVSRLHLAHTSTPQEALTIAMGWLGGNASVAVFTHGAEVLSVVGGRS